MAESRNCINCGAPIDINLNVCPYCGTSYYDLSAIDLNKRKPMYLKLRMGNMVITQKCIPYCNGINISNETTNCVDRRGNIITKFYSGCSVTTDITFNGVADSKGQLFTVQMED